MSLRYGVPLFFRSQGYDVSGISVAWMGCDRAAGRRLVQGYNKKCRVGRKSRVGDNMMRSMLDGRCEKAGVGGKGVSGSVLGRRL